MVGGARHQGGTEGDHPLELAGVDHLVEVLVAGGAPERTEGRGDLAYVYCRASWVNGRPPDTGATSKVRGVMIWRKQADGRWLIAQEVLVPEVESK